jgi:hypothetical protein
MSESIGNGENIRRYQGEEHQDIQAKIHTQAIITL